MKILKVSDIEGTKRDVDFTGGHSVRLLLESDNMGYSFMKTIIPQGDANFWHYPHHLESCFCTEGRGELTNLETGEKHEIIPDTMYVLDNHEKHTYQAFEDTVLISVFNPPLNGLEHHDDKGIYPVSDYKKKLVNRIISVANESASDYDLYDSLMEIL